jgi:erythromycin esterase
MRIVIILVYFFVPLSVIAQKNEINWLRQNAQSIRTLTPYSDDFSDLQFLKTTLKDKRVVMLGEHDHNDGATVEAKARMIKFLHQEMGYTILIEEGGMYGCDKYYQITKQGKDTAYTLHGKGTLEQYYYKTGGRYRQDIAHKNIMEQGITNKQNPLIVQGMDLNFEGGKYIFHRGKDIEDLLLRLDKTFPKKQVQHDLNSIFMRGKMQFAITKLDAIKNKDKLKIDLKALKNSELRLCAYIESIKDTIRSDSLKRRLSFYQQVIRTEYGYWDFYLNRPEADQDNKQYLGSYFAIRDKYMGENLRWYIEDYFPNQKIIVSTASFHTARNTKSINAPANIKKSLFMCDYIWEKHKNEIYSIAFLNYQGRRGKYTHQLPFVPQKDENGKDLPYWHSEAPKDYWPKNWTIKPIKGSLEEKMHFAGFKYGFLDFQNTTADWLLKPFLMFPTYFKPYKAEWWRIYDGVFFIDTQERFEAWAEKDMIEELRTDPDYYPKGW